MKDDAPAVSFPLDAGTAYLQTTDGASGETQHYKVQLSADVATLTLTYMERGGVTTYSRVK
jgi:hypothetical protein